MKKIKIVLAILVGMVMILSFTACQQAERTDDIKSAGNSTQSKGLPEKLTNPNVTVAVTNEDEHAQFEELAKVFEPKYGGKITIIDVAWQELESKIIAAITSGDAFDCVYWNQEKMPRWAIKNLIQPIDDYFDLSDPLWVEVKDSMDQFKYKGKYYGVSQGPEVVCIYYNKTLFENNGVKTPMQYYKENNWNWNTLKEAATALTKDTNSDGQPDQWGYSVTDINILIASNDTQMAFIKDDGNIELNLKDPKVVETLQFYQDGQSKFMSTGNWANYFPKGQIAMVPLRANKFRSSLTEEIKFEWDIAPFPAGPGAKEYVAPASCGFWAISVGAKNPEGAAALLYLRQKQGRERYYDVLAKEGYTKEQIELIKKLEKHVNINTYTGLGNWKKVNKNLWNKIGQGNPVMTTIEQDAPLFQAEIDSILKEAK